VHRHQQETNATRQAVVVEQSNPVKAEPAVSPTVSPAYRTWQARIEEFVKQFVLANQLNDEAATLALYAPTVDYFRDYLLDTGFHCARLVA
jgi:hypothetical protein